MPTFLFTILFYFAPIVTMPISRSAIHSMLLVVAITTFFLPLLSITTLIYSSGKLQESLHKIVMEERRDRIVPFFFTAIFYGITTYMFISKIRGNTVLIVILVAITLIVLIISLITIFFKVSAHSAGAAGLIGFLVGIGIKYPENQLLYPLTAILLLSGLVISARLYLNVHKPSEVLVGSLIGFLMSFGAIYFYG